MAGLLDDFADYMVKQSIDRTDPKKPSVPLSSQVLSALQGASNAAATNLSAPVDGIAWLLRKAGVPIPANPVGGSDWMAQKGLTREPQNRNAGLLGEAIGGVAPMLVAAKAPQIAKGLLQAGDNLAAPATLNKQAGVVKVGGNGLLGAESMPDMSYQITHKPMTVEGGAAPLHDLTQSFGDDVYGKSALQYYGSGDKREAEILKTMSKVRGNPNAMVTIYRGVPKDVKNINAGDWVTLHPSVAKDYADLLGDGVVVSQQVPASHVTSWPDSLLEFGYHPK